MAIHLTRIYIRTGDDGTSGLSDFSRVSKNDERLVAYADCDEANAVIGLALASEQEIATDVRDVLLEVQNDLFDVGADLATPHTENPQYPPLRITTTNSHPGAVNAHNDGRLTLPRNGLLRTPLLQNASVSP